MNANVLAISATDIAGWALPAGHDLPPPQFYVQLPALQRGAVWSAEQVELLWDSLVRGSPIGCLILCEPKKRFAVQSFALQRAGPRQNWVDHPNYLLLDGQQRCTAVAVGFLSPWVIEGHADAEITLWVDLEAPDRADVRDYVFRLLTRSHPWGYQRQNPGDRLSVSGRRHAMAEFKDSARRLGYGSLEFSVRPETLRVIWVGYRSPG